MGLLEILVWVTKMTPTINGYIICEFTVRNRQHNLLMYLVIDTKEKTLSTSIITNYLDSINISYEKRNLDVGDLAIYNGDEVLAIFERKTCKDMAASINDGRYREQKIRLLNKNCRWKGYILEGTFPEKGITFPTKAKQRVVAQTTYFSIITGLTLRDGLHVYTTNSTLDTAKLLGQMLRKIPDYNDDLVNYQQELIKSVSTVRKENMTPEVCYLAQLCQIPGVSHKIAKCIQNQWSDMSQLLNAEMEQLIEINLGERRLGKVLAARIIDYMKPKTKPTKLRIVAVKKLQSKDNNI